MAKHEHTAACIASPALCQELQRAEGWGAVEGGGEVTMEQDEHVCVGNCTPGPTTAQTSSATVRLTGLQCGELAAWLLNREPETEYSLVVDTTGEQPVVTLWRGYTLIGEQPVADVVFE